MTRAELLKALMTVQQIAVAVTEELKRQAEQEFEEGSVPQWTIPGVGRIAGSVTHERVVVTDEDDFMDWARDVWPDEVVEETTLRFRHGAFREKMLTALRENVRDRPDDFPFAQIVRGGEYNTTSITLDRDERKRVAEQARAWIAGTAQAPELTS